MEVIITSANSLAASPTQPAHIAGAALRAWHTAELFEILFAQDINAELMARIERFQPNLIGVSIRLVHAYIIVAAASYAGYQS